MFMKLRKLDTGYEMLDEGRNLKITIDNGLLQAKAIKRDERRQSLLLLFDQSAGKVFTYHT